MAWEAQYYARKLVVRNVAYYGLSSELTNDRYPKGVATDSLWPSLARLHSNLLAVKPPFRLRQPSDFRWHIERQVMAESGPIPPPPRFAHLQTERAAEEPQ